MQLADEAIEYSYANALQSFSETWSPLAELQAQNLLTKSRIQALSATLLQVRGQVAAEREVIEPRPEQQPLQPGFIDLPTRSLGGSSL